MQVAALFHPDHTIPLEPCGGSALRRYQLTLGLAFEAEPVLPQDDENPGPHFALLRKLAVEAGVEKLSMGMSGDFESAIEFGSTSVRVGSAIFGNR